jgi:hypothetical protein
METESHQDLKMELVETTSVLSKVLNLNCTFDGSNLIYLAGANIVQVRLPSPSTTSSRTSNTSAPASMTISYKHLPSTKT